MKKYMQIFKITAAFMLLVSFFLPMSSCSYTVPLDLGVDETAPGSGEATPEERTVTMYAREYNDLKEFGSWLNIFSFTWPFFVIVFQTRFRGREAMVLFPSAGVLLSVMTGVVIYAWADVGKPLIGAYVGWCAAAALLLIHASELADGLRGRKTRV